ncbi:MAG: DNA repair exonuclease [Eubacteriales bacterium]|jgi:exonuclease SbcD|nr:DNA repair exonuclease [Eubacteriales bacterium]
MEPISVKVLHCADIHLDSPFADRDPEKAAVRRSELRGAFSSLMTYARLNEADIVLIAGDLFDSEFVTSETISLVLREFARNASCRFVISPGNHDPYTQNGIYDKTDFPPNVYIFDDNRLSVFSFDDLNTDVYGYAFTSPSLEYNPFAGRRPENSGRLNILCAHGELGAAASLNCPIKLTDITSGGFDYVALGHIHNSDGVSLANGVYYGYSGCLEGRDFGECGYKGALFGSINKTDGVCKADIRGLRFSKRRYEILTLNLTGMTDAEAVYDKISAAVEKKYGNDTSLRLVLEGEISPSLILSESIIRQNLENLFSLQIKNNTLPLFDYALLEKDQTIRGEYFRCLLPLLQGDEADRSDAALALRYGFSALAGSDIPAE